MGECIVFGLLALIIVIGAEWEDIVKQWHGR